MGFGSAIKRGDRKSTYRAKYDYKGQTVSKTFHDRLSAQAWLNSEKSRVEADKAGVTKWTSPTDRKRQEQALERRRRLLCDYVMEDFAPNWLSYSADGTELAEGSKRKHREYLRHLTHAFFWKYPIAEISTEDVNRWLNDIDNFNGPTPRKKTFQLLKSVYTKAVNEGVVNRSPVTMKSPPVPKSKQAEIPPATGEELKIIYNAMPECTRVAVWLGAILDLRIGEVVSLQVRDFNPKTQTLRIQHSAAKLKAERPDLVFHTLRATSITAAVQVGASLRETMRWGRHADAATSIERYQRESGTERMREIADSIESALMGHKPTKEELETAIAETKKRLTELETQLTALLHQNK